MKLKAKRILSVLFVGLLFFYVGSYCIVTRKGFYEATIWGLANDGKGHPIFAPKTSFGYDWNPFGISLHSPKPKPAWVTAATKFYAPLIFLDQNYFRRNLSYNKASSGQFRVKGFFDIRTNTSYDINLAP